MTKYKYTKKNCYNVAKGIIDGINDNQERGVLPSHCNIYLYEQDKKLIGYVHIRVIGFCKFILKEKVRDNMTEITDWFKDRSPYTKKELADMIYHFYEVAE